VWRAAATQGRQLILHLANNWQRRFAHCMNEHAGAVHIGKVARCRWMLRVHSRRDAIVCQLRTKQLQIKSMEREV